MLNQPTIERLQAMKLLGMADAFREQTETADSSQLSFEERFGLLVDRQWTWKEGRALGWAHRDRQDLAGVCPGAQSLSRWFLRLT
jgi:hypothetical protein